MTTTLQTKTEEYLTDLIAEVSEIARNEISVDADFQELGLDSRFVVAINARLESHFRNLPRTMFFEYPSIRAVAGYLVEDYADTLDALFEASPADVPDDFTDLSALAAQVPRASTTFVAESRRDGPIAAVPSRATSAASMDIAIIGVAGRYPKARNIDEFWRNLREGLDCVELLPEERWTSDPSTRLRWGGFIDGVAEFDPLFFNMSPVTAEWTDPQERLFLEVAWETIESAGYDPMRLTTGSDAARVGVFVGVMYGEYQLLGAELTLLGTPSVTASSYASIANRVSHFLDLRGPSVALDTMCSSSLTAIHLAVSSLRSGDCRMALVGGTNVTVHPNKYRLLEAGHFLASDGRCRSYGEGGDGYVPAEGVGAVLLKPLADALRDEDTIWSVIKGTSVNHGGRARGYSVPDVSAQAASLLDALQRAEVDPSTLGYIEGHGTGTALGDPIEFRGLHKAIGSLDEKIPIGSVKSNIGHAESAAGIAGLTKVLLQLRAEEIAPSIHCEPPNPNIDFERAPVEVQRHVAPWKRRSAVGLPRRAVVAAFGAGGSNAHVVLEEAPERPVKEAIPRAPRLFVLSARSAERLHAHAQRLLAYLARLPPLREAEASAHLYDLCATLQLGRTAFDTRLAIVADSHRSLQRKLAAFVRGKIADPDIAVSSTEQVASSTARPLDEPLADVARLWVTGTALDMHALYPYRWQKLALPTYPFERQRYWPTTLPREHRPPTPGIGTAKDVAGGPSSPVESASSSTELTLPDWLRKLFASILRLDVESVQLDRSLFEYGLESVSAVEFAERINSALGLQLTPTAVFEFRTIADFSRHLVDRYGISERVGVALPLPATPASNGAATTTAAGPSISPSSAASPSLEQLWRAAAAELGIATGDQSRAPSGPSIALHVLAGEQGVDVEYAVIGEHDSDAPSSSKDRGILYFSGLLATHELLTLSADFRQLAKRHPAVLVHPPGAGRSGLPNGELTLDFIVKQAEHVRRARGWQELTVVGYSFGGVVAQAYAVMFPERVRKVALVCTTSEPSTVTEGMNLAAAELERYPAGLAVFQRLDFAKMPIYGRLATGIRPEMLAYDASIPTMIVAGAEDGYVPPSHARRLAESKGNAAVWVVPGAGHFLGLSHGKSLALHLDRFIVGEVGAPRAPIRSRVAGRSPVDPRALSELERYLAAGDSSSGVEISPLVARVAFIVNRIVADDRVPESPLNCFFLPSGHEAVDAALRYASRRAKLTGRNATKTAIFDPNGDLLRHFEFLPGERLFSDLDFIDSAEELLARIETDAAVGAVYLTSLCEPRALEAILEACSERRIVSILAELHADSGDVLTPRLGTKPDVVVFDEGIAGFSVGFGICAVRDFQRGGVWTRQPDDFAVRHPGSMTGPAMVIVLERLRRRFGTLFTSETQATLDAIATDQKLTKAIYRKYVNPALIESLEAFGLAVRQTHADRKGYTIEYDDGRRADVINFYLFLAGSVRGHTGIEVGKTVIATHDESRKYGVELARRIHTETGFDEIFPAASLVTATESALKLGLLAARKGSSLLVLKGSPLFTKIGSLVSQVDATSPVAPLVEAASWPAVIAVDPFAEGAASEIERALVHGNIGLVWLGTLQFEWSGLRAVPDDVLAVIERHRSERRYLVAADETYTAMVCGTLFHWQTTRLSKPDLVSLANISEGQIVTGYTLTTAEVARSAAARDEMTFRALRDQYRGELDAHATLECFDVLARERALLRIRDTERVFAAALDTLAADCALVSRVRGNGLIWVIELETKGFPKFLQDWISSFVWSECLRDPVAPLALSMLPLTPGTLRMMPRFDIPPEQLDAALGTLRRVLSKGVRGIVSSVADNLTQRGDDKRAELFRKMLSGFAA